MPFSLTLLIFVLLTEYWAIQKEKQNEKRRHTQSKFADHDCMSSTKANL